MSLIKKQTVVYPDNVQEIVETLDANEMIIRLKDLLEALRRVEQEPEEAAKYKLLATHLVSNFFLKNENREIKISVACCISEILRIFAPDAPYDADQDLLRSVLIFLIKQLTGLATPSDPLFNQCFVLLENLAIVKTLNIVLELEACQEILAVMLKFMFAILNEGQIEDEKIQGLMVDVLAHILNDAESLSVRVLDSLLINLIEPHKSENRYSYKCAGDILTYCSSSIQPHLETYLKNLTLNGESYGSVLTENVFEILSEIYQTLPEIIVQILSRLESVIKNGSVELRLNCVRWIAKLISDTNSTVCDRCPPLWTMFLSWFNDSKADVRLQCVRSSVNIYVNQPKLCKDISGALINISRDPDVNVRAQTITSILKALKKHSLANMGRKRNIHASNGDPIEINAAATGHCFDSHETKFEANMSVTKIPNKKKLKITRNNSSFITESLERTKMDANIFESVKKNS